MNHWREYVPVSPPAWGICQRALLSFIQSAWSKKRDGCSLAHEICAADADRFERRVDWNTQPVNGSDSLETVQLPLSKRYNEDKDDPV